MVGPGGISRRGLLVAAGAVGLAACTPRVPGAGAASRTTSAAPATIDNLLTDTPTADVPTTGNRTPEPGRVPVDPASVQANELGVVPVMMYHRITTNVTGPYDTSPADFRAGLQRMFAAGFRPVRTIDLARGTLDVAAGRTPVVLTFDDGYPNQFRLQPDGTVDPTCGVGILLEVCRQFPDCPPAGSFNVNRNPFGLADPAGRSAGLRRLHELGFEIANHTFGHDNLSRLSADGIQRDFVQVQRMVIEAVPGVGVRTMALPFGVLPAQSGLVRAGAWDGDHYVNEATLMVGANPSPSPFDVAFDPNRVPRIRSTSWRGGRLPMTATYWLDYLAAHPRARYISSGNPATITFPKAWPGRLAAQFASRAKTY